MTAFCILFVAAVFISDFLGDVSIYMNAFAVIVWVSNLKILQVKYKDFDKID